MSLGRLMDLRMGCGTIWRLRSQTKRWTAQSIAMSRSQTVSWTSPQQACITLVSKISIYGKRHWHLSVRLHSFKIVVTNWSLAFSHMWFWWMQLQFLPFVYILLISQILVKISGARCPILNDWGIYLPLSCSLKGYSHLLRKNLFGMLIFNGQCKMCAHQVSMFHIVH